MFKCIEDDLTVGIAIHIMEKNPKMPVLIGQCVAGFQPSEKLCKKLKEEYGWNIYIETKNLREDEDIEEVNEPQKYYEKEEQEVEAIRKQVYLHEDGEKSVEYFLMQDGAGQETKKVRTNEELIEAVKELGEEATEGDKPWRIAKIPPDIEWYITENDAGYEWVAEKHRTWAGQEDYK